MILIIEIGNSNIVIVLYENQTKIAQFRIRTIIGKTSDEYLIDLDSFFNAKNIERSLIRESVMASVVAPLIPVFQKTIFDLLGSQCRVVDWMSIPTMPIEVEEPNGLGIDRLINAFAAYDLFGKALIVIDMGTATTFDVVSKDGKYLGGVISPGLLLSLNALISNTNKLPKIELVVPESVIGKNTIHAMQSGAIYGYAGMVDAMVVQIKNELGYEAKVIATGGLANVVKTISSEIEKVIDDLTVEGLLKISQL
jgi:type III pantothenate kinase